jgi:hypothetical protein
VLMLKKMAFSCFGFVSYDEKMFNSSALNLFFPILKLLKSKAC